MEPCLFCHEQAETPPKGSTRRQLTRVTDFGGLQRLLVVALDYRKSITLTDE
jgi:hypothetical protein